MNVWVWIDRYKFLINIPIFGTPFTRNRTSCSLPSETGGEGIEISKNLELGGSVVLSRMWGFCWAVVTPDLAWCKRFGIYFTVHRSVRMLLLGKSLQTFACRSRAGSGEQKVPTGGRGPPAVQGMGLCSAMGALHASCFHAEVKSSSCPVCCLSGWSSLVICLRLWGKTCSNFILVMNLYGDVVS